MDLGRQYLAAWLSPEALTTWTVAGEVVGEAGPGPRGPGEAGGASVSAPARRVLGIGGAIATVASCLVFDRIVRVVARLPTPYASFLSYAGVTHTRRR